MPPRPGQSVFFGPNGLRAGWRIFIFIALLITFAICLASIPALRTLLQLLRTSSERPPAGLLANEAIQAVALALAAAIMARVEGRSFSDYGLPARQAFRRFFWSGVGLGFTALTLLVGLIAAFHGYFAGGAATGWRPAAKYGLVYALVFLLTGFFEEFCFRGYLQFTLGSAIGFWPAAIVLAICFGALHLTNGDETKFGAGMVGVFALLMAFCLRRTGNLWLAIGVHSAWDWGETFFYSVPDSGVIARGHLLNAYLHGPKWLTGGAVGPEGSLWALPVLLLLGVIIHLMFPFRRANT